MISTNFMIGTGFIKCMPITFSGRLVTEAIWVIDIEDVFVAKIVLASQMASTSLKIFNFKSICSVAASTTKSQFFTPSLKVVKVMMLARVFFLSDAVITSLAIIRSKFFVIVAIPFSKDAIEISIRCTWCPF